MTTTGALIRRHRERAGLTQLDLADRARLSERTLRSVERDEASGHHFATLWALTAALELTSDQAKALIRGAAEPSVVPLDDRVVWEQDETQPPMSLDDFVCALASAGPGRWRELVTSDLVRVDADGQIASLRNTRILEPLTSDADSLLMVLNGDGSTPVRWCEVAWTHGCEHRDRLDAPSRNLSAFSFDVPAEADPWAPRSVTFEVAYGASVPAGERSAYGARPRSDGMTRSSVSLGSTISVDVVFERPPATVWTLSTARGERGYRRGRVVEPDADGLVQLVHTDTAGETVGFEWQWGD